MKKRSTEFKETEIGIIPEDWECKKIAETSDNDDVVQTGPFGSILHARDYADEGIPLLLVKNVADGILKDQDMPKVNFEKANELKKFWLQEGDIVFTRVGAVGRTFYVAKDYEGWMFSGQTLRIRIQNDQVNNRFVEYFFRTPQFQGVSEATALGTTRPSINTSILANTCVPLPHKTEQDKIVKIVFSFDEKLRINRLINNTLEKMGQALFKHWFIDFEFPNEKGKPYRSSGGEMVDSELGEIPEGWQIKEINDCGKVVCGKTPSTQNKENYGDDIPFITIPDMRGNVFVVKTEKQLSKLGAETQAKKELPSLAVCVSCIATPGLVSLTSIRSHTNQQINSIICNSDITPYFMFYTMREKSEDIQTMGLGGTATLNLNTGDFSKIKILVPDKRLMEQFHTLMVPLFKQLLEKSTESLTLVDIRDSLLPRLMSGKIRVNFGGAS